MVMRTYGLSGSGVDVDSMVKDMMKAANVPLDKLNQKKTLLEWKKDDYTAIHKTISDFRNKVFDYKLEKNNNPQKVISSDESVVSATSSGGVAAVAHTLEVTALAKGASATSTAKAAVVTTGGTVDRSSLAAQFGLASGTEGTLMLNGKSISISAEDSIYDVVRSINKSGAGVQASYDSNLDRFFLSTNSTGANMKIDVAGSDSTALSFLNDKLNMTTLVDRSGSEGSYSYAAKAALTGQDASFNLDGQALSEATNTFSISGVTYTLKKEGSSATVSVTTDVEKTIENVKSFIESYNAALSALYTKTNETYKRDYTPLTSAQKEEMSDDEVSSWEKIAKTGLLHNDPILNSLTSEMRNNMASKVTGISNEYNSLASIGITTGTYTENGKLYLNETKLRAALQEDPSALSNLFGSDGSTKAEDGIATRLYDSLKKAMDKIDSTAGVVAGSADTKSALAKQLTEVNKSIKSTTTRLTALEERYYKQFDAMETMIQQMSQQSSWISQMMGTSS